MRFGDHLLTTDVGIPRNYADATARTAALPSPEMNQLTTLTNRPGVIQYWSGSAWVDQMPLLPGEELAYNQITANVSLTNASAAQSNLVIEGTTRTYDGSPILVEVFCPVLSNSTQCYLNLFDASTDLGYFTATGNTFVPASASRRITPTPGTHNYRIGGWSVGGTGIVTAGTGVINNWAPAYLRVTRV